MNIAYAVCIFYWIYASCRRKNNWRLWVSDLALFVLFYCWSEVKVFFSRKKKKKLYRNEEEILLEDKVFLLVHTRQQSPKLIKNSLRGEVIREREMKRREWKMERLWIYITYNNINYYYGLQIHHHHQSHHQLWSKGCPATDHLTSSHHIYGLKSREVFIHS